MLPPLRPTPFTIVSPRRVPRYKTYNLLLEKHTDICRLAKKSKRNKPARSYRSSGFRPVHSCLKDCFRFVFVFYFLQ